MPEKEPISTGRYVRVDRFGGFGVPIERTNGDIRSGERVEMNGELVEEEPSMLPEPTEAPVAGESNTPKKRTPIRVGENGKVILQSEGK